MRYYFLLALVFTLSITFFIQNYAYAEISKNDFAHQIIGIDNATLDVMIADTPDKMIQGLQNQQQLSYNQGMLFVVPTPQLIPIWMPNMQFSLDIIWFDSKGGILHVEKNVPPCTSLDLSTCPIYYKDGQPAKYVLEVTSGFVDKNNISINSKLVTSIPEFSSLSGLIITMSIIGAITLTKFRIHF